MLSSIFYRLVGAFLVEISKNQTGAFVK